MVCDGGDLKRALATSPDTVTEFLERLVGEELVAEVVRQSPVGAGRDDRLDVAAGETLVHRIAVLKGHTTDVPYVVAESTYVPDRLPARARAQLSRTGETIGRALTRSGLSLDRRSLSLGDERGGPAPPAVAASFSEIVWSRAYLLVVDGVAAFAVQEWFLRPVLDALERRTRGTADL